MPVEPPAESHEARRPMRTKRAELRGLATNLRN